MTDIQNDVIVVLGAAVWEHGVASPSLKRRMKYAIKFLQNNRANWLLLTGGVGKYPPSEAKVMKRLAMDAGISEKNIVLEESGTTTWSSAKECSRIILEKNWSRVILITDSYHAMRSILAFRCFGIKASISCPPKGHVGTSLWRWWYFHMREIGALTWYIVLCVKTLFKRLFKSAL